jgi:hypothetical protein
MNLSTNNVENVLVNSEAITDQSGYVKSKVKLSQ